MRNITGCRWATKSNICAWTHARTHTHACTSAHIHTHYHLRPISWNKMGIHRIGKTQCDRFEGEFILGVRKLGRSREQRWEDQWWGEGGRESCPTSLAHSFSRCSLFCSCSFTSVICSRVCQNTCTWWTSLYQSARTTEQLPSCFFLGSFLIGLCSSTVITFFCILPTMF